MIPTERIKMYNTEPTKITITAEDEKSLYSPFSPEPTFSDGLKIGLEKNNVITFEYCNDKEKQAE